MCVSPIRIRIKNTSSYTYRDFSGKTILHRSSPYRYTHVPCGKCFECRRRRVNELIFRASQEYLSCNKRGIFLTLTYNNVHLPLHPYVSEPGSKVRMVSVWDKKSVQTYFKSLNEKILYEIGTSRGYCRLQNGKITKEWRSFLASEPRPLSYLCVCERGASDIYISDSGRSRTGTARPHYHVAVFLKSSSYDIDSLKKLMVDSWTYGLAYPLVISSQSEKYRDELGSIRYICKYMNSSDLSSYDHPLVKMSRLVFSSDKERLNALPFTLISKFFGAGYLETFDCVPSKEELCSATVSISSSRGAISIGLPLYYRNKLTKYTSRKSFVSYRYVPKTVLSGNPETDSFQSYKRVAVLRKSSEYCSEYTSLGNACRFYSRYLLAKSAYNTCFQFFASFVPSSLSDSFLDKYKGLYGSSAFSVCNVFRKYFISSTRREFIKSYIDGLMDSSSSLAYSTSCFVNDVLAISREHAHQTNELEFKRCLSSAIRSKPELFNVLPI